MTDTERERHIKTLATGKNPGSITGISKAERAKNRETAWARKSGVR